jgi:hypothetical protein
MAMTSKPRVVVLAALPALGFDLLRLRFDVAARGPGADSGWLREHAPGAAAIVADPSIPVGPELMDAAGTSLKVISNARDRPARRRICLRPGGTGAYLAAVFLVSDARRFGDPGLERYFATRALGAASVAGVIAVAGLFVLHSDARYLYYGLTSEGLPFVLVSGACGAAALVLLLRRAQRGVRLLAVGAAVAVIWGWGAAQYPYLLPETLTIEDGAGAARP